jgi:hypothetical protein
MRGRRGAPRSKQPPPARFWGSLAWRSGPPARTRRRRSPTPLALGQASVTGRRPAKGLVEEGSAGARLRDRHGGTFQDERGRAYRCRLEPQRRRVAPSHFRACANRRVAYVSRSSQKAVQSLREMSCAKSCPPIGAASKKSRRLFHPSQLDQTRQCHPPWELV